MKYTSLPYEEITLSTKVLEVPRKTYQRPLNAARVRDIAYGFDEHIANEPKVSFRDGHYYVFDGQHTIAARIFLNGGQHLLIRCKVYYDLTERDEALLFAQQTGVSAKLTAGAEMRANIFGGEPEATAFLLATEAAGVRLDYSQSHRSGHISCIKTALSEYRRVGAELYTEALKIIVEVWNGDPDSLRAEIVQGMTRFVELYHDEYNRKRLISRLRKVNPIVIYREGRAIGNMPSYKKYLYQILSVYNGFSRKNALELKI